MTSYLSLTGVSGVWATTPDDASLDITGDLDLRVDVALNDWSPATTQSLIGKFGAAGQRSYEFGVRTTGVLRLTWSTDGTLTAAADSTANLSALAAGERRAVRVTFDADNGAAGKSTRFYTAPTMEGPWTQLGSTVTSAGVVTVFSGTSQLGVGAWNSAGQSEMTSGKVYAAQVRSGIDGTIVANPIFSAVYPGDTQLTDSTGKLWSWPTASTVDDGEWDIGNADDLQDSAQEFWGLDLNGALRAATGINSDKNGISHRLWGRELHAARNQAYALLRGGGGAETPPP